MRIVYRAGGPRLRRGLRLLGLASLLIAPNSALAAPTGGPRPAAPLSTLAAGRLDPRLVPAIAAGETEPRPVWVVFADKGERGAGELALGLERARAALTPRALARRLRARVSPLVDYRDLPLASGYLQSLERGGYAVIATSRWLNRAAVRAPATALPGLAELPFVSRIEPVERMRRSAPLPGVELLPAAPSPRGALRRGAAGEAAAIDYGRTFHMMNQMNVPAVHDSGYIGTGVLVCVLDNGFNNWTTHEALATIDVGFGMQRDFVDGDTVVTGVTGGGNHGTNVLGCIAGNLPGAYVGSGYGASFALGRTEADGSETPVEMLYWGMGAEWADSLGADLISSSLGYFTFDNSADDYTYADMDGHTTLVTRAAEIAASKGILVVNAVGNEGNSSWHYLIAPADVRTDSLIAVGAVDVNGTVAGFSSHGPNALGCIKPDLAARGVSDTVVSTFGPTSYQVQSGTSFATPLVSGLAACLIQARPTWPATLIARALRETASQAATPDNRVGWGIPNGLAALQWQGAVGVGGPPAPRFGLALLGPNPLRSGGPPLRIRLGLGRENHRLAAARLRIFDAQGREVRELWEGELCCDETIAVDWDGRTGAGDAARPGLYFVALESGGRRAGARVILLP